MSLKLPKFISLENIGILPELSGKIARCAVNVPTEDGLWWSLSLSLLYPVPNENKFASRLKKLIKFCYHPDLISNIVQKDIDGLFYFLKEYNPFLDRQSCFNNTFFKNLLETYKERHVSDPRGISTVLSEACQLVECNIIFYALPPKKGKETLYSSEEKKLSVQVLTIYSECQETSPEQNLFYFGINGEILQEKALITILKTANFREDWVRKIKRTLSSDKNIPLNLVRNEFYEAIKLLYKQTYTLIKLKEAGFVVDPFSPGNNGESAFSLATGKKNARAVVYTFYIYSSSAERNYDPQKIERLSNTSNVLQTIKTVGLNSEETVSFIEQLTKFNNFQIDISSVFYKIHTHSFSGTANCTTIVEVSRRRAKLMAALPIYLDYFYFRKYPPITEINGKMEVAVQMLKNMMYFDKYINYFEILDLNAALLFFDNLFFVKHRIRHSDSDLRAYEEVESRYLSFLFSCEVYGFSQLLYPSSKENEATERAQSSPTHKSFTYNVFFERRNLFYALLNFHAHMKKTPIILEKRKRVFDVLTLVPTIKDVITLRTILRYLSNVLCFNTTETEGENEEICLLVTERLLHILGELLSEGPIQNVTLGKLFLMSSFVPEVRQEFCKIRNTMVHIKRGSNAHNRLNVERSMEIFERVKPELQQFKILCEEFLEIMELQMKIDILRSDQSYRLKVLNSCRKVANIGHELSGHLVDGLAEEEKLTTLNDIQNQVKGKISVERRKKPELIESFRFHLQTHKFFSDRCKTHLEVQIAGVEHYMDLERNNPSHFKDSILFHIRCIEVLLSYCIETFKPCDSHFKQKLAGILSEMKRAAVQYAKQSNPNSNVLGNSRKDLNELFCQIYEKEFLEADIKSRDPKKFSNVLKLGRTFRHFYPLSEAQKYTILDRVPQKFVEHSIAKQKLSLMNEQVSKGKPVSIDAVMRETKLLLQSKDRRTLEYFCGKNSLGKLCTANKIKDPFGALKQSLENNKLITRRDYHDYCSKFEWQRGTVSSDLLERFTRGYHWKTDTDFVADRKAIQLRFLNKKITSLENLLIKSDPIISKMWYQEEDPEEKKQAQFLMVQKFLRDKRFQAATEMLLLDIMSVHEISPDLENLWIKASDLFSGINLRNVLAHHNPLVEELWNMLDPDDLATEIVSKCLKIVENRKWHDVQVADQNPRTEELMDLTDPNDLVTENVSQCVKIVEKGKIT